MRYFLFCLVLFFSVAATFGVRQVPVFAQATGADVAARQAQLERELDQLNAQIGELNGTVSGLQSEGQSLKRDIAILDARIKQAQLSIEARNITIRNLASSIAAKERAIGGLNNKLGSEKESLAQLLRATNEIDSTSLLEVALSNENLSEFFGDLDAFDSIKAALSDSFKEIGATKTITQAQKGALEKDQADEVELRTIQQLQQRKIKDQEAEKQRILKATQGQEAAYASLIKAKQKSAAQIRAELFTLRGTAAIPFQEALDYANTASKKTGVRPALILGIIAEESNLGENVGTGSWRVDMKSPRDTEPFLRITAALGLDPDRMPVSKKPWYGWGGAMGPAQFIPSTWVLYEERVAATTGNRPANPWNPQDAFMASAILLKDNGAAKGTVAAERLAALRYLAGWVNATKPAYAFYGDDVMQLAAKYQELINILGS